MNDEAIKRGACIALAVVAVVFGLRIFLWGGSRFEDPNDSPLYESTLRRALQNFKQSDLVLGRDQVGPSARTAYGTQRQAPAAGGQAARSHSSSTARTGTGPQMPPGQAGKLVSSGLQKYHNQDYAGAVEDFQNATRLAPTHRYTWLYLGMAYTKINDAENAGLAYAQAKKLEGAQPPQPATPQPATPQPAAPEPAAQDIAPQQDAQQQTEAVAVDAKPEDFIREGMRLYMEGKYDQAMPYLDTALKLDNSNLETYYTLANCCYAMGDLDKMLQYYQAAAKIAPDDTTAQYYLGLAYSQVEQTEDAIAAYEQAIRLDPNNIPAREGLGRMLQRQGRHDEAMQQFKIGIDHCQKKIDDNPDDPAAYNDLAKFYLRNSIKLDEAAEIVSRALALAPSDAGCLATDAQIAAETGDYARALVQIDKAIAQKPHNVKYYTLLRNKYAAKVGVAQPVAGE